MIFLVLMVYWAVVLLVILLSSVQREHFFYDLGVQLIVTTVHAIAIVHTYLLFIDK